MYLLTLDVNYLQFKKNKINYTQVLIH